MPQCWKFVVAAALALTLVCGGPAASQTTSPEAIAAARELVTAMRATDMLKGLLPLIVQQLKPAIVQNRPEVERDFDATMPILLEGFAARSGEFTNSVADIYARNFTTDEIRQITAFYRGPIGEKLLQKLPTITQESMAMGQKFGQAVAGELRNRMIEELRKRGHKI